MLSTRQQLESEEWLQKNTLFICKLTPHRSYEEEVVWLGITGCRQSATNWGMRGFADLVRAGWYHDLRVRSDESQFTRKLLGIGGRSSEASLKAD